MISDKQISVDKKYIPLDKSWIIRMGILDIINGYDDIQKFLSTQNNLSDDLVALQGAAEAWKTGESIDVGESGTLYRLLKFASWKLNLNKKFITRGTLTNRNINNDSKIINRPQSELLKLDNNTSQWASATVLLGDSERLLTPPYKLQLTYEAVNHWKSQREKNEVWLPRYDETILRQAEIYKELLRGKNQNFIPKQAEDFCFAYIFGYMTAEEGEGEWPALRGHETDRIFEVQKTLQDAEAGKEIRSKDHRVVQAMAMWGRVNNKTINIIHPSAVNKSWPQFWDFIKNN